jgi:hypothetical protein
VETELGVGGEMHVTGWRGIPQAGAITEGERSLDLLEAKRVAIEVTSARFLAGWIEHLGMMQRHRHDARV